MASPEHSTEYFLFSTYVKFDDFNGSMKYLVAKDLKQADALVKETYGSDRSPGALKEEIKFNCTSKQANQINKDFECSYYEESEAIEKLFDLGTKNNIKSCLLEKTRCADTPDDFIKNAKKYKGVLNKHTDSNNPINRFNNFRENVPGHCTKSWRKTIEIGREQFYTENVDAEIDKLETEHANNVVGIKSARC